MFKLIKSEWGASLQWHSLFEASESNIFDNNIDSNCYSPHLWGASGFFWLIVNYTKEIVFSVMHHWTWATKPDLNDIC